MLQAFLRAACELFYPDNCLLCREFLNSRHQRQLCPDCLGRLELNPRPFAPATGFAFDQAWSAYLYNDTAKKLLHAFKYNAKISLSKTFVPLMIDFINSRHLPVAEFDGMSSIPLHPARLRERGYNQAGLLSVALSRHYGLADTEGLLMRRKMTQTQTELGAKQRWTNMEGAFRMKTSTDLTGKRIILIDDLFTTGATLNAAAEALKAAGATEVAALTLYVAA